MYVASALLIILGIVGLTTKSFDTTTAIFSFVGGAAALGYGVYSTIKNVKDR